jgi:hypothetical protein
LSPKGEYDIKFSESEDLISSWAYQNKQQRSVIIETDHVINNRVYADISEEEELYVYKKQKARELMKKQQDAFYANQSKLL